MRSTSLDVAPAPVVVGLSIIVGLLAWGAFMSYMPGEAYAAWQIIGAALVVGAGAVVTRFLSHARHAWATVAGAAAGFLLPWAWFSPQSGSQFVAASIMLSVGLLLLLIVVTLVTDALLRVRRRAGEHRERRRAAKTARGTTKS